MHFKSHHYIYIVKTGPSVFFMTVTMMILFGSAFFTDVIGVQAIFGTLKAHICALNYLLNDCMNVGAFLTGLIVPREGGLAIAMTEKLEDMVTIIFLPLVCRLLFQM